MAPKKSNPLKKGKKVETEEAKYVDSNGFYPTPSSISPEELEDIIREFQIQYPPMILRPSSINCPGLMHTPPTGCFTLPIFALRAGLSLPFSNDHARIFQLIGLPLCQLSYNAFLLINSYLIISRWFNWADAPRNFTHLARIIKHLPNKWEYSMSIRPPSFIDLPNNSHPGFRSKFIYVSPPVNHPFVLSSLWTSGKASLGVVGENTIPGVDLEKLKLLRWDAESLSVRDTLRAAGLIFPFDRHWSAEERARRRSYLGKS